MATFTVTTVADSVNAADGKLSLREALARANVHVDADTITFAAGLEDKTIALTKGQLDITSDVTITGDPDHNGHGITFDQRTDGDVFRVSARVIEVSGAATEAKLDGVTVTGGRWGGEPGGYGTGILMGGGASLHLLSSRVTDNFAPSGNGGGIFAGPASHLTVVDSDISGNGAFYGGGGLSIASGSVVRLEGSTISGNTAEYNGGGIEAWGASISLLRTAVIRNSVDSGDPNYGSSAGGGISVTGGSLDVVQSTVACNTSMAGEYGGVSRGAGIAAVAAALSIRESTVTGNVADHLKDDPAGLSVSSDGSLELSNSIVAGNLGQERGSTAYLLSDVDGIDWSNGHNVLGVPGTGAAPGDVVGADPAKVFAQLDAHGGGQLVLANGTWVVPLRDAPDNPALSGADPATAGSADQRGAARPLPGDSAPDIGAYELSQAHVSRTASAANDILTGTGAANTLNGLAGNDLVRGLAGNDTLKGSSGSDTLDGGAGNDRMDGGGGTDTVTYATATAGITVSLATTAQQSTGGSGLDTLLGIENLTGSRFVDHLTGNASANLLLGGSGNDEIRAGADNDRILGGAGNDWHLEGGLGRDILTGGAGNDRFDFDAAADSLPTAPDRITDFQGVGAAVGDLIDLADLPGTLVFRGTTAFTGIGQVRVTGSGNDTLIRVNLAGSTTPEMEILVQDGDVQPGQWTAGDFIL